MLLNPLPLAKIASSKAHFIYFSCEKNDTNRIEICIIARNKIKLGWRVLETRVMMINSKIISAFWSASRIRIFVFLSNIFHLIYLQGHQTLGEGDFPS